MYITVKSFRNTFNIFGTYTSGPTGLDVKNEFHRKEGVPVNLQHLFVNNRPFPDDRILPDGAVVYVSLSLPGGKGGFGSMLRAIGAQIEKTTNREACRDLSGRRLRDINEEKRLKEWISKQAEREQDLQKKRIEKLERMKAKPKHEFHDPEYDRQRSDLPEKVANSVLEGLKSNPTALKRKSAVPAGAANKKSCLWLGLEGLEGEDSDMSDEENKDKIEGGGGDQRNSDRSISDDSNKEDSDKKLNRLSLDLSHFESVDELMSLGGEVLSNALSAFGAKCGGTLEQKAERLWALKGKGTLKKLNGPTDIVL